MEGVSQVFFTKGRPKSGARCRTVRCMPAFFAGGRGCREARVHLRPAANTFPARTKGAGLKGAPTVDEGAGFLEPAVLAAEV